MRRRELLFALGTLSFPTFSALTGPVSASAEGEPDRSPGFIESNRPLLVGLGTLATIGGLALLVYKVRVSDPSSTRGSSLTGKLEREDLIAGGEAQNPLERLIQVANRPKAYPVMALVTVALTGLLALAGFPAALAVGAYGILLLVMMAFLSFGWPLIEARFERSEPTTTDSDSLRVQGFSTDTKVFISLFVLLLGAMLGLILLETLLR